MKNSVTPVTVMYSTLIILRSLDLLINQLYLCSKNPNEQIASAVKANSITQTFRIVLNMYIFLHGNIKLHINLQHLR